MMGWTRCTFNHLFAWFAPILAALLAVVMLGMLVDNYVQSSRAFNSDNLYCNAFCDDLLRGRDMRGWHLPGAPYLFPDVLLLIPYQYLFSNLVFVYLAYCITFYSMMAAILTWIARMMGLAWRQAIVIVGLGLALLVATHLDSLYINRATLLVHAGNHVGAVLLGLLAAALVLHALRAGLSWRSTGAIMVVCSLGAFSDKLLVVQFIAPILVASFVLAVLRLAPILRTIAAVMILALATLLSFPVAMLFQRLGFILLPMEPDFSKIDRFSWMAFIRQLGHCTPDQWILNVLIFLNLIAALTAICVWLRKPKVEKNAIENAASAGLDRAAILYAAIVVVFSPVCNLGAAIVTGLFDVAALDRYILPCFILPFVFVSLFLRVIPWRTTQWLLGSLQVIAVGFAAFRLVQWVPTIDRSHLEQPYPALARTLDDIVRERGPIDGLGSYWTARYLTYLTKEHISVRPVDGGEALPWFHACNPNDFLFPDPANLNLPAYRLLAWSHHQDPRMMPQEKILQHYGPPQERIHVGIDEIWIWNQFDAGHWKRFLRAQLARRMRRQLPYIVPESPASLAHPKTNFTSAKCPDNVPLSSGESLDIRFAGSIQGRLIDFAANYLDRFSLGFYRGQELIGSLSVPTVPWTAYPYGPAGIQSRLLQVPPSWSEKSWDRIRVTAKRDGVIAHCLIYADDPLPPAEASKYTAIVKRFEGEQLPFIPGTEVRTISQAGASGGSVRRAAANWKGFASFGPYINLPPGRYRVDFALSIEEHNAKGHLATIDAFDGGPDPVAQRELTAQDFPSDEKCSIQSLTVNSQDELDFVEFRLWTEGKTAIRLDYVEVTSLPPELNETQSRAVGRAHR